MSSEHVIVNIFDVEDELYDRLESGTLGSSVHVQAKSELDLCIEKLNTLAVTDYVTPKTPFEQCIEKFASLCIY